MDVSVCLPTYNEEDRILELVDSTEEVLIRSEYVDRFEIIVSDGSSDDKTVEMVQKRVDKDHVELISPDGRRYYGESIMDGFDSARYEYFILLDGDGSISPGNLDKMFPLLEENDVLVGQRSLSDRKPLRGVLSYFYNSLTINLFGSDLMDHHCGAKAFKRSSCEELFEVTESVHWYWDTEILLRAQNRGLDIEEFGATWNTKIGSEVDVLSDSFNLFKKSLEFKFVQGFD